MPWTHWRDGREGVMREWNVEAIPTIYVLDAHGVIRYRDIRDKELENAVQTLLKEMVAGAKKDG
jgi:hypothetical protein